jgi:hypothetical protein
LFCKRGLRVFFRFSCKYSLQIDSVHPTSLDLSGR